jgi:hypothetical protein
MPPLSATVAASLSIPTLHALTRRPAGFKVEGFVWLHDDPSIEPVCCIHRGSRRTCRVRDGRRFTDDLPE